MEAPAPAHVHVVSAPNATIANAAGPDVVTELDSQSAAVQAGDGDRYREKAPSAALAMLDARAPSAAAELPAEQQAAAPPAPAHPVAMGEVAREKEEVVIVDVASEEDADEEDAQQFSLVRGDSKNARRATEEVLEELDNQLLLVPARSRTRLNCWASSSSVSFARATSTITTSFS